MQFTEFSSITINATCIKDNVDSQVGFTKMWSINNEYIILVTGTLWKKSKSDTQRKP